MRKRRCRSMCAMLLAAVLLASGAAQGDESTAAAADAMYKDALTAYTGQDYKLALSLFRKLEQQYPDCKHAARGYEYLAQCENRLGDPYAAFEAYQAIWDKHKDFAKLAVVTRNQMKIGNYYLEAENYKLAIDIYQKILLNASFGDVAPAAQYSLAKAYTGQKDYEAAKIELAKVIKNYPSSQLVDDAAFELGYVSYVQSESAQYDLSIASDAVAAFRRFISDFPSSPKVAEAQRYIQELRGRRAAALLSQAEFYDNIEASKAAQIAYREVVEQYPDTTQADTARSRIGDIGPKTAPRETPRDVDVKSVSDPVASKDAADEPEVIRQEQLVERTGTKKESQSTPQERTVVPAPRTNTAIDAEKRIDKDRLNQLFKNPETGKAVRRFMVEQYSNETVRARIARADMQRMRQSGSIPVSERDSTTLASAGKAGTAREKTEEPSEISKPVREPLVVRPNWVTSEEPAATNEVVKATKPVKPAVDTIATAATNIAHVADLNISGENDATEIATATPKAEPVAGKVETNEKPGEPTTESGDASAALALLLQDSTTTATRVATVVEPAAEPVVEKPAIKPVATKPVAERPVIEPVTEPASESDTLAKARVAEQERAAETRKQTEAARERVKTEEWTASQITADGRVRRAKEEPKEEKIGAAPSDEALRQEYIPIWDLVQRADASMQQGRVTEAQQRYSTALDLLLKLKQKAPMWQSEIVNYRIDYCRERMKSLP